jgi:hypothetical protein
MVEQLTWDGVLRWRLRRHHLTGDPATDAVAVARRLCGVHAQLAASAITAVGLRSPATSADVDAALDARTLVKSWAARGTLHLLPAADYWTWVGAMSTRNRETRGSWQRYHGVTADGMALILGSITEALGDDALTREELTERIVKLTGHDELVHPLSHSWGGVLKPAADKGLLCFGPPRGRNVTFVSPAAWLGPRQPVDPGTAIDTLVRAHLDAYGPSDPEEFSRWFALDRAPLAKKSFARLAPELVEVDVEGRPGFMLTERLASLREPAGEPAVHLLPAFDPYVIGSLRQLDEVVLGRNKARVSRPQGWISPVLAVDGRIMGVWTGDRRGDTLSVTIEPFGPLARPVRAKLADAADRVAVASGATGADLVVKADPI